MGDSNGLAGAPKKVSTIDAGALGDGLEKVGERNVPTAKVLPRWLRPKSAEQLAQDGLEQVEKFFKATRLSQPPLERISLNFRAVRGRIDSTPMWSDAFDKAEAKFPEHSVQVHRDDMGDASRRDQILNRLRIVAAEYIEELRAIDRKDQNAAEELAAPPLDSKELAEVPELDSAGEVTQLREGSSDAVISANGHGGLAANLAGHSDVSVVATPER